MSNKLITTSSLVKVSSITPSPTAALEAFNLLVKEYSNYKQVVETEKTKRQAIKAWSKSQAQQTKAKKEILKTYLEASFSERQYVIDEMFKRLDIGLETGNDQLVITAMTNISNIVQTSPLQEAEKLIQAMNDPNIQKIEF